VYSRCLLRLQIHTFLLRSSYDCYAEKFTYHAPTNYKIGCDNFTAQEICTRQTCVQKVFDIPLSDFPQQRKKKKKKKIGERSSSVSI